MDYKQAEKGFKQLKTRFTTGVLSETEFKTKLEELMIQDEQGCWWMIGYETEQWYRHDGAQWIKTDLPNIQKPEPIPLEPEQQNIWKVSDVLGWVIGTVIGFSIGVSTGDPSFAILFAIIGTLLGGWIGITLNKKRKQ